MNLSKIKCLNGSYCYYIFFIGMSILKFTAEINNYLQLIIVGSAVVAWGVKYLLTEYSKKQHFVNLFLITIGCISVLVVSKEGLMLSVLAIIGAKDIEVDKLFKNYFYICGSVLLLSIVQYLVIGDKSEIEMVTRHFIGVEFDIYKGSLGYGHANYLFLLVFLLLSAYIYTYFETFDKKKALISLVVSTIFFTVTFSRTGYISMIALILLAIFMRSEKSKGEMTKKTINNIPLLVVAGSFILPYIYYYFYNPIIDVLDKTIQGRIYYSVEYMRYFGVKLWGQNVNDTSGYWGWSLVADNSFVNIVCSYGLVVFLLVLWITYKLTKTELSNRDRLLVTIFYIYCFAEANFALAFMNLSFVSITKILYANRIDEGVEC